MRCLLLLGPVLALSVTGCGAFASQAGPVFVHAMVVGGVIAMETERSERNQDVPDTSDEDVQLRDTSELLNTPAAQPITTRDDGIAIPVGALRAAVASVDLTSCSPAPRGYGHARVTLEPDGHVSKVVIDGPTNLPPSTVRCIADALSHAHVDAFGGRATTVGTTWFVRGA